MASIQVTYTPHTTASMPKGLDSNTLVDIILDHPDEELSHHYGRKAESVWWEWKGGGLCECKSYKLSEEG